MRQLKRALIYFTLSRLAPLQRCGRIWVTTRGSVELVLIRSGQTTTGSLFWRSLFCAHCLREAAGLMLRGIPALTAGSGSGGLKYTRQPGES